MSMLSGNALRLDFNLLQDLVEAVAWADSIGATDFLAGADLGELDFVFLLAMAASSLINVK
jgi:hypothetical protein